MDGITITDAGAEFFLPEWSNGEWRLKLIKRPPASLRTFNYNLVEELDGVTRTSAQTASSSDPETPAPTPSPTVTTAPSITAQQTDGAVRTGATITGTAGSYTGSPAIQRSWSRDGQLISGATGLTITASQAGSYVMREVATNAGGSVTSSSNTLVVQAAPAAPTNTSPPSITGNQTQGSTLTRTAGTWSNAQSIAGQWLRNGTPISMATGASYTTQTADVGQTLTYRETATSADGQTAIATSSGIQVQAASSTATGTITAHPQRTIRLAALPDAAPRDADVAYGAIPFAAPLDPHARLNFAIDFSARLRTDERIAAIERIALSNAAIALGAQIDAANPPFIGGDGKMVQFRITIAAGSRGNAAYAGLGTQLVGQLAVATDQTPDEAHDQTWIITARHT